MAAPRVFWPSSKTRVAMPGDSAMRSSNGHTWIDCSGGGACDSNAIRSRLNVRASSLGLSWEVQKTSRATSKPLTGKPMLKTVFDTSVWTLHRNVYAGAPSVGEGLELLEPSGRFQEGNPINLYASVPAASDEEIKVYEQRLSVKVNRAAGGRLSVNDNTRLLLSSLIEMDDGMTLTVADFLRDDSYASGTKYRCQAMFRDSNSWNGIIRKFENGQVMHHDNGAGITFWLSERDWQGMCLRFSASAKQPEDIQAFVDGLASMSTNEWAIHRDAVSKSTGIGVGNLDKMRKSGRWADPQTAASEADEREYEDEQIEEAIKREPQDIVNLRDGRAILTELHAHWLLLLGGQKTEAVTFFNEPIIGSTGTVLKFRQFALPSLKTFCEAYPVHIETDGGVVAESPVDLWASSPRRRGVRSITFEPGFPGLYRGAVNLWRGWGLEPTGNDAACSVFLEHVRDVIAAGDEEVYQFLTKWMAKRVQGVYNRKIDQPLERMIVAIVMRSTQGTGKGLFETYFAKIFGGHALITARGHGLTGRFNWQFAHLLLLAADEAFFAGSGEQHDILKSFQTEPTFDFEQKYRDSVSLPNHCATLMSTNKDWAVPADAGDRRMCVIDVSDCRKNDRGYFRALAMERDGDGPAALMGYLLDQDLTGFEVEDFPRTDALLEQQIATIGRHSATFEWLYEALTAGGFVAMSEASMYPKRQEWPEEGRFLLDRQYVGDAIRDYAVRMRHYRGPSNESIGRDLHKMIGCSGRQKGPSIDGRRPNVWEVPGRREAMSRLQSFLKTGGS